MEQEQYSLHVPVLLDEVLDALQPVTGGIYVDGTFGLGGHTRAILERSKPHGQVVGFEWDEDAVNAGPDVGEYEDRFTLIHASYADLVDELSLRGLGPVNGLIADLGVSSLQLDRGERGFSFRVDSDLDMRMDRRRSVSAADLIAQSSEEQLADIFFHYGEERQARRIAKFVVQARQQAPITTTGQLAALVADAVPRRFHPPKIHVATRVFQALRIAVNGELDNLSRLLNTAPQVLAPGARVAMITFHSLEDRIVKQMFLKNPAYRIISKRPIEPTDQEMQRNPRARSAKLRVAERV
nr:16S rRNA (cytosine(1402)-N(4))-methyltransferase RsmH [uncultured Desulfobulbus sp.]